MKDKFPYVIVLELCTMVEAESAFAGIGAIFALAAIQCVRHCVDGFGFTLV
jgi:hypothetical protein